MAASAVPVIAAAVVAMLPWDEPMSGIQFRPDESPYACPPALTRSGIAAPVSIVKLKRLRLPGGTAPATEQPAITARSTLPSPLNSPLVTPTGIVHAVGYESPVGKVPSPLPNWTTTALF